MSMSTKSTTSLRPAHPTKSASLHVDFIPDISVAHLYLSVVQDLAGESDQLALWCAIAIYTPFDMARRQKATLQEWLERTGLPIERLQVAWQAVAARGLIAPDGIPGGLLRLESLRRAHPYANYLRSLEFSSPEQTELELGDQH
jgi:hypothetical protein